ncbi:hypothetical protein [Streptomyces sp. NPDC012508]|uniref:hypothetical protein n=1 Tax=Streptomyces sp. NPDC012508 TaxID=3364837 RepID=UPI003674815D
MCVEKGCDRLHCEEGGDVMDGPQNAHPTDKDDPARRPRGTMAALAMPLGLLAGILLGMALLDDVGLGIALGLGAGAVAAGAGSMGWGRPVRDAEG